MISAPRASLTPLKYASHVIDPSYGTAYTSFIILYLKQKYAGQDLSTDEIQKVEEFYPAFEQKVKQSHSFWQRTYRFKNLNHFVRYFILPEESEINLPNNTNF